MDKESLKQQFQEKSPIFKRLEIEGRFIIERALFNSDIKIYSISSRIKDVDSFLKKVERKESKNPFEEIQDIVGLRIVCLFLSDINRIGEIIRCSFGVIHEDNKIDVSDASSFGYLSVHFIAKLGGECSGPRYDGLIGIPFEIQVRTIAMDAWANISHYLDYKSEIDIPRELRRDFYALSGLFYVADTHFEMFFKSRQKLTQSLKEADLDPDQEINLDTLTAYLRKKFSDRESAGSDFISYLTEGLLRNGYKKIGDVDRLVDANFGKFLKYEKEHPPADAEDGRFMDTGVVHVILFEFKGK